MNAKVSFVSLILLPLLGGCLTAHDPKVTDWFVTSSVTVPTASAPKYGVMRLSLVSVSAPYDAREIAVLRSDGSIAFDPCNRFAAQPSRIVRPLFVDIFAKCGIFKYCVAPTSAANVDTLVEVDILRMALDCRENGKREACVELRMRLLNHTRDIVATAEGVGTSPTADGNYSAAFSRALDAAALAALKGL